MTNEDLLKSLGFVAPSQTLLDMFEAKQPQFQTPNLQQAPSQLTPEKQEELQLSTIGEFLGALSQIVQGRQPSTQIGGKRAAFEKDEAQRERENRGLSNQVELSRANFLNQLEMAQFQGDEALKRRLLGEFAAEERRNRIDTQNTVESAIVAMAIGESRKNEVTPERVEELAAENGVPATPRLQALVKGGIARSKERREQESTPSSAALLSQERLRRNDREDNAKNAAMSKAIFDGKLLTDEEIDDIIVEFGLQDQPGIEKTLKTAANEGFRKREDAVLKREADTREQLGLVETAIQFREAAEAGTLTESEKVIQGLQSSNRMKDLISQPVESLKAIRDSLRRSLEIKRDLSPAEAAEVSDAEKDASVARFVERALAAGDPDPRLAGSSNNELFRLLLSELFPTNEELDAYINRNSGGE